MHARTCIAFSLYSVTYLLEYHQVQKLLHAPLKTPPANRGPLPPGIHTLYNLLFLSVG